MSTSDRTPATVDRCLRLGHGFAEAERPDVVAALSGLDAHLAAESADVVDLDLSVKDRDAAQQRVTLLCRIAGLPEVVATAEERDLHRALTRVRDEAVRQVTDERTRRRPDHRS